MAVGDHGWGLEVVVGHWVMLVNIDSLEDVWGLEGMRSLFVATTEADGLENLTTISDNVN